MHATDQGLIVNGEVDRDVPEGKQVWKSIKAGTAGFSIGYLAVESTPRKSGGRTLAEIDCSRSARPALRCIRVLGP